MAGWTRRYEWGWGELSAVRACVGAGASAGVVRDVCGALYAARAGAADRRVLRVLVARCTDERAPPGLAAPLPYTDNLQVPYIRYGVLVQMTLLKK